LGSTGAEVSTRLDSLAPLRRVREEGLLFPGVLLSDRRPFDLLPGVGASPLVNDLPLSFELRVAPPHCSMAGIGIYVAGQAKSEGCWSREGSRFGESKRWAADEAKYLKYPLAK
jgi:hypothetical protein